MISGSVYNGYGSIGSFPNSEVDWQRSNSSFATVVAHPAEAKILYEDST